MDQANLNSFFDLWGEEYLKGSKRDQVSLPYALWKYNKNNSQPVKVNSFNFYEVYREKKFFEKTQHLKTKRINIKTYLKIKHKVQKLFLRYFSKSFK